MSERPSAKDWTCQIRIKGGRLPDIAAIGQHLEARRIGASLRAVEATVEGELIQQGGIWLLKIGGTGEVVELAPLVRKVEWDVAARQPQMASPEERKAFDRLRSSGRHAGVLQVVGPLAAGVPGGRYRLEVRQFRWL